MSDDLTERDPKPCPHCNSSARIRSGLSDSPTRVMVECSSADCKVRPQTFGADEDDAVWLWNHNHSRTLAERDNRIAELTAQRDKLRAAAISVLRLCDQSSDHETKWERAVAALSAAAEPMP